MVNGHNMSPEEQKAYYGSKDAKRAEASRKAGRRRHGQSDWDSLSPEAQEAGRELWDLLYHHYTLVEFYDELEEHPWSSGYNSSEAIDKIIEYNGAEFQKLYDEYKSWVESGEDDIVKPKRPPAEFNEDDDDEEDDE